MDPRRAALSRVLQSCSRYPSWDERRGFGIATPSAALGAVEPVALPGIVAAFEEDAPLPGPLLPPSITVARAGTFVDIAWSAVPGAAAYRLRIEQGAAWAETETDELQAVVGWPGSGRVSVRAMGPGGTVGPAAVTHVIGAGAWLYAL